MAAMGQSERVRSIVVSRYVDPAKREGRRRFSVPVREVLKAAEACEGFPRGRTPTICSVLQSKRLLQENGLEIERMDGPPSGQSSAVVVHYRVRDGEAEMASEPRRLPTHEEAVAWVERVTAPINGVLSEEIAAFGGADALMRWIRPDDEVEA